MNFPVDYQILEIWGNHSFLWTRWTHEDGKSWTLLTQVSSNNGGLAKEPKGQDSRIVWRQSRRI